MLNPDPGEVLLEMSHSVSVALKALRLEVFGEDGVFLSRASGFLIDDHDGLHLYTCWHVVAGVDFLNPFPKQPPKKRSYLVAFFQHVDTRQPGIQSIGGQASTRVDLYSDDLPTWKQGDLRRSAPDLEAIGLPVPRFFDVVRIPVSLDASIVELCAFRRDQLFDNTIDAGNTVAIVGYPYGFSAMDDGTPEPVFLMRGIASNHRQTGPRLLDGAGAPAMSGSPVLVFTKNEWKLLGMYNGQIFPDAFYKETPETDRFAALGLMSQILFARLFMGVVGS